MPSIEKMLFSAVFAFSWSGRFVLGWDVCRLAANGVYMPVQGCLKTLVILLYIGMKYVFQHYFD